MKNNLQGVMSAIVTPFYQGEVDYESLTQLVKYQIKSGLQGLVVNGTTAESPTLSKDEVIKIFRHIRALVGDKFPLILGTGSNSTVHSIEMTKLAGDLGADAALVVVPYYNKPTQKGLIAHFKAIAEASQIPIVLYNVPGRTITAMTADTIAELSKHKNILCIKEASGDISFFENIKSSAQSDFTFLSGDDLTYLDFLDKGGHGIISVMSNLLTAETVRWTELVKNKNLTEASRHFEKYKKLVQLMYCEANPIPIKWMLFKKGLIKSPEMRLPLTTLDEKFHAEILTEMKKLEII
ncbi:MAG: 4-hydroxy-tetrahydrodipicolinate synthase [Pseudobdellovibrio sp.]